MLNGKSIDYSFEVFFSKKYFNFKVKLFIHMRKHLRIILQVLCFM